MQLLSPPPTEPALALPQRNGQARCGEWPCCRPGAPALENIQLLEAGGAMVGCQSPSSSSDSPSGGGHASRAGTPAAGRPAARPVGCMLLPASQEIDRCFAVGTGFSAFIPAGGCSGGRHVTSPLSGTIMPAGKWHQNIGSPESCCEANRGIGSKQRKGACARPIENCSPGRSGSKLCISIGLQ